MLVLGGLGFGLAPHLFGGGGSVGLAPPFGAVLGCFVGLGLFVRVAGPGVLGFVVLSGKEVSECR